MPNEKILLNNLGRKQSVNEIWPVYIVLQKETISSKNSTKLRPEN